VSYTLHLNGRPLSRWLVTAGTFFRPPVTVRSNLVTIPGRHGVMPVGPVTFDEPQIGIVLTPNTLLPTNLLPNSAASLTGWEPAWGTGGAGEASITADGACRMVWTTAPSAGSTRLRFCTATTQAPVVAGQAYTFTAGVASSKNARVVIDWVTAGGAWISSSPGPWVTSPLPTVASVTATAPAGAAYASAFLMVQAVATGDWLEGSSPMLLPVTPPAENLDTLSADLSALLASPSLTVRRTGEGRVEEAPARLVSIAWDDVFREGVFAGVTVVLALPEVFWRDQSTSDVALAAGSSNVSALAGSGPITDAVLRWGPGSSGAVLKSLTDVTTGTGVSVNYAPTAGEYVYVRLPDLRAWSSTSSTAWTPSGTNRSSLVDHPGPGPLQLWPTLPASGARQLPVTASHAVTIRARRAWL
jgi:hypothetical protein